MSARRLRTGVIRPWRGKSEWAVPLLLFLAIVLVAALAFNVANLDTGGEAIPGGGVSGGTSPSALGVFDPFLGDVFLVIFASVVVAMLVVAVLRRRVQQKAPAKPFSWWQVISSAIGLILVFALLLAWPRMIQAFRIGQTPPTTGDAGGASATGWPVAAGAPLGLFLGLEDLAVGRLHVSREASSTLTSLFEEARYSEHPLGEADRRRAIESLAGIRVALEA